MSDPITVTNRGPRNEIPVRKLAEAFAALVPGKIKSQVNRGLDVDGKPFAPYTPRYARALSRASEDGKVDLRLTGGLLNSIATRSMREVANNVWEILIAPDTGTSPAVSLVKGRAKRTARRGPPHNVVGYWLHNGTPKMRARPWLGLSPESQRALIVQIMRSAARGR